MKLFRNLALFLAISMITIGCGGGNTTIADNNSSNPVNGSSSSTSGGVTTTSNLPTKTVTLNWTAPTTWNDNSPISPGEIGGYRIYYGTSATNTPNSVAVNDGTLTQYTLSLPSGTYYFRMTTVSTSGVEGPMSAEVQRVL